MQYNSSPSPVRRSLDIAGTPTANASIYEDANCRLRLNGQGLPVAIRRVGSIGQPGSFAQRRFQVVKPNGIVALSLVSLSAWEERHSHPVN